MVSSLLSSRIASLPKAELHLHVEGTLPDLLKDKALLGKFSQDKKVEFEFVEQGSNYVITSVK